MEIQGVTIRTIVADTNAIRCDGCLEAIEGTPWRINLLDIVAPEKAASWTDRAALNPGPFEFHSASDCVRAWMARRGIYLCRRSQLREIMRPVPVAIGERAAWGLCDGVHRDDHEFVPA
jgi:hypothetical protein